MNLKYSNKSINFLIILLTLFTVWASIARSENLSGRYTFKGSAEIDQKFLVEKSPNIKASFKYLSIVEDNDEELVVDVEFSDLSQETTLSIDALGNKRLFNKTFPEARASTILNSTRQKARLRVVPDIIEINKDNYNKSVPTSQLNTDSIEIKLTRIIEKPGLGLLNDIKQISLWRIPFPKTWHLVSIYPNLIYHLWLKPIGRAEIIEKKWFNATHAGERPLKAKGRFSSSIQSLSTTSVKGAEFHSELLDKISQFGGLGPGQSIDLSGFLQTEPGLGMEFEDVFGFSRTVLIDKNPDCGIVYVYPNRYFLGSDNNGNPAIRFLYQSGKGPITEGRVTVRMTLVPSLDQGEMSLAKEVLGAYSSKHGNVVVRQVLPLPLAKPPQIVLEAMGHFLDIPEGDIVVEKTSRVSGRIYYNFITTADKVPNINLALENRALKGKIVFTPAGGQTGSNQNKLESELDLKIAEDKTFTGSVLNSSMTWRNRTLFPVYPKYVHALFLHKEIGPLVYSWTVKEDSVAVQPSAQVRFQSAFFPSWLFNQDGASKIWASPIYDTDCEPCLALLRRMIQDAAIRFNVAPIAVETFTPLADYGAAKMTLYLRSRYHSPKSKDVGFVGRVALTDSSKLEAGLLYLPEKIEPPYFEYAIRLYLKDGTPYPSSEQGLHYLPHDSLELVVGSRQVKDSIGEIPNN